VSAPRPILIHGSGGDHRVWTAQTAVLAGAVVVDLPGRPGGAPVTDVGELAERVCAAVATVPGPRALVGHSLGGAVALEAALARPDLIDGVVVIASAARLRVPDETMERATADFAAERDRLVAGSFSDPGATMASLARAALEAAGPGALAADYAACRSVDLRGRLDALRIPVLAVAGGEDPFVPPHHVEALVRELPMGAMALIPGARHMAMAEFDVTANHLIAAYLARLELTLDGA
jgi:3-oxoadipate enol-lactonase